MSARKGAASGARNSGYHAQVSLDEESDKSKERSDDDSSSSSSSWDESDNWVQPSANGNRQNARDDEEDEDNEDEEDEDDEGWGDDMEEVD